jgi:DNA-directed RNA polymerase specialized sigma24 family protein
MELAHAVAARDDTRGSVRRRVEGLVDFAEHLAAADRALVVNVFERGASATDLARAMGEDPRHVRRRLTRLVKRLASREFRFVVRHRSGWTPNQRRVADAVILRGMTQRDAARALHLTLHQVRTYLHAVHVLIFEHTGAAPHGH